jgi:hypothetical protein
MLEDFLHNDPNFDPQDFIADDFALQDLLPPDAPVFDYTTDNEIPDYLQPPALPRVRTKQSECAPTRNINK